MDLYLSDTNKEVQISDHLLGRVFNEPLVHQVVTAYLASGRNGTRAQKSRGEVRGGGKKPWRQKGIGRARAGTIRSPIWRGGGKTFAAKPTDYIQKVNKKMYRGALRAIFSELLRQQRLVLVEDFVQETTKTKELLKKLVDIQAKDALIVTESVDDKLRLSARNLPTVEICEAARIDPVRLINFEKVLITLGAVRHLEKGLT